MSTELTTPIKIEIPSIGTIESADLYIKADADKVIANLEESHKKEVEQLLIEIVKLNEGAQNLILDNYLKDKKLCHSKYKRCLAMAKWCENAILGWMGYKESFSSHQRYIKVMLFTKWHKRWLELAEKFKSNNEVNNGEKQEAIRFSHMSLRPFQNP